MHILAAGKARLTPLRLHYHVGLKSPWESYDPLWLSAHTFWWLFAGRLRRYAAPLCPCSLSPALSLPGPYPSFISAAYSHSISYAIPSIFFLHRSLQIISFMLLSIWVHPLEGATLVIRTCCLHYILPRAKTAFLASHRSLSSPAWRKPTTLAVSLALWCSADTLTQMVAGSVLLAVHQDVHIRPLSCRLVCLLLTAIIAPATGRLQFFWALAAFADPSFPDTPQRHNPQVTGQQPLSDGEMPSPIRRWTSAAASPQTSPHRRVRPRQTELSPDARIRHSVSIMRVSTPPPNLDVDAGIPQEEARIAAMLAAVPQLPFTHNDTGPDAANNPHDDERNTSSAAATHNPSTKANGKDKGKGKGKHPGKDKHGNKGPPQQPSAAAAWGPSDRALFSTRTSPLEAGGDPNVCVSCLTDTNCCT